MRAYHLNHPLKLETPEQLPDGAGGQIESWVTLGTLWGDISARTGREAATAGAPVSRTSYRIVVRGAPFGSPQRPRAQQRFRYGERVFNIEAVAECDVEGRYLACFAEEELVV